MKNTLLTVVILIICQFSFGQKQISIDSVKSYVGQEVKVCATFYGMKENEKVTLINIGAAYPQSPLTIVIYAKDKDLFKKTISNFHQEKTTLCAIGTISEFKGKLQIVVEKPAQLVVSPD
jgi:hypothetical protein